MIRIRFVTGKDWLSRAIRLGERDGWPTHVDIVMPDESRLGAHINGGVQIRPNGYDSASITKEEIVSLPVSNSFGFYDFLHRQVGKPYDIWAVFGLGIGRDWRSPDSWFCSELAAAALEACGYFKRLSATNNHISPRDLRLALSAKE